MASLASIAQDPDAPRMIDLFPIWHSFQVLEVRMGEFKHLRLYLMNEHHQGESELQMYLGHCSAAILQRIKALSQAQGVRLQFLETQLAEAINCVERLEVKAKARLLQLGELPKPDRHFDWENDTDCGDTYVVKHGFEQEIDKVREAVRRVEQQNKNEFIREGVLMSKILHAITTTSIESQLPYEIAKQWVEAIGRDELPKFTGLDLVAEIKKIIEEMREQLLEAIAQRKKQKSQLEKRAIESQIKDSKKGEKLVWQHQYPEAWDGGLRHQSPESSRSPSPSLSSPSYSTVTTFCDNCQKKGHGMGECWEFDPEEKEKAIKTLRAHKCNRCGKFGHHENSCWEAFPEKKAAALKWRAQRRV